jgi:hypothetical protein
VNKPAASDPPNPKGTLLRTREGDLDFGWVILIFCCLVGMSSFVLEGLGIMKLSTSGWVWFGSFTTMSFIAGAAVSRARLIANADVSAAHARAIDAVTEEDPKAGASLAAGTDAVVVVEPTPLEERQRVTEG